jgi:hypothetical protein
MMATSQGGGNFRDLKAHLPLFDEAVHRHDRGWPHPPPGESDDNPKRRWKRVGIFHFPHHDEDEGEDEARNAGSG